MKPHELAKLCGVSVDAVRGWCYHKQIKFATTPGGHRRFRREDVLEFLEEKGFPLPQTGKLSPIRVLVVDDDIAFRNSLFGALQKELDFNVKEAANVYEVGRMVGLFQPDVLIIDPGTPDIDCSKICRDFQAKAKADQKKMVIVIGRPGEARFQESFNIGADLCLTKPVNVARLIELIRKDYQRAGKRKSRDTG